MNRRSRKLSLAVLAAGVIGAAVTSTWGWAQYRYGPVDSLLVLCTVDSDATVWAPGFSEARFRAVPIGATTAQVVALLGMPLGRVQISGNSQLWYYSDQAAPPTRNSHRRVLVVGPDGLVTERRSYVYVD
jgi:outer membrane protein assembly factor BamE (lipoprotein component of BamABCDE complex)